MDELTAERFGFGIPWQELRTRPTPLPPPPSRPRLRHDDPPPDVIAERRLVLCDDVPSWVFVQRRLVEAIRRSA